MLWTDDQVESLNEYQASGVMHPFTCERKSHDLVATNDGWYCPECEKEGFSYTQNWCHEWMVNWKWKSFGVLCSKPPVPKPPVGQSNTEEKG